MRRSIIRILSRVFLDFCQILRSRLHWDVEISAPRQLWCSLLPKTPLGALVFDPPPSSPRDNFQDMLTRGCLLLSKRRKSFPLNPRGAMSTPYTPCPAHPASLSDINTHKIEHNSRKSKSSQNKESTNI